MTDLCLRYLGSDGTADVPCHADLLCKGSAVLCEALSPEFRATLPVERGIPVLKIQNTCMTCADVRDALEYAQEPESIADWEWSRCVCRVAFASWAGASACAMQ